MNPALLIVLFALGSLMLIGGTLGWALGALPMPLGITLLVLGAVLESAAVMLYAQQKKQRR